MVDKIDRPDPVNKYDILPTKETHDEGQRKQGGQRDEDDEYSSPGTEISWNKYRIDTPNRQVITIPRSDIHQAIFRQAMLQSRTAVLEMDLLLTNGRTLPRTHMVSSNMDDYWKWKGWVPGQVVPLDLMVQGATFKISVQQLKPAPRPSGETTRSTRSPIATRRKRYPWHTPAFKLDWLWIAKVVAGCIVGLWVIGKLARWW
jgi:hypothetical protein